MPHLTFPALCSWRDRRGRRFRAASPWVWLSLFVIGISHDGFAQAPSIQKVSPIGLKPGETAELTLTGANLTAGGHLWTSLLADPLPPVDGKPNQFRIETPEDVQPGVHAIRIFSENGASRLFPVLVDPLPAQSSSGNNQSLATSQTVEFPIAIDGQIDNLSRRFYRFSVTSGQQLTFDVWAGRLGSPLDPIITLLRPDGQPIAYVDDTPGLNGDAQLVHQFEEGGEYVVELRDIQHRGGGNHFFRLRIDQGPLTLPTESSPVPETSQHETLEQEPNQDTEQATAVEIGSLVSGTFQSPGDIDLFRFSAGKDERLRITGITRQIGLPTDLVMRLLDSNGKQLAMVDDTGTNEGILDATIPAEGEYLLELTELHGRGGSEFGYQIDLRRRTASFSLQASTDALNVPARGTTVVTVDAQRVDYSGPIELSVENLPPGVTSVRTVIGPGVNQAHLTLRSTAETPELALHNVRIIGRATQNDRELHAEATVAESLRTPWNTLRFSSGNFRDAIVATVVPASGLSLSVEPQVLDLARTKKATIKITAERGDEITEAITLATLPDRNPLPTGLTVAVKNIDKGKNEVELELSATDKAPLGPFTLVFQATHRKGNKTTTTWVPGTTFTVVEP